MLQQHLLEIEMLDLQISDYGHPRNTRRVHFENQAEAPAKARLLELDRGGLMIWLSIVVPMIETEGKADMLCSDRALLLLTQTGCRADAQH